MNTEIERAVFSFTSHAFLQTREAPVGLEALKFASGRREREPMNVRELLDLAG
jgi:hypothetical protein